MKLRSQAPRSMLPDMSAIPPPPAEPQRPKVIVATPGTSHGVVYWIAVGWWWGPLKWVGRVILWLALWPVGLWRSVVHGRKSREAAQDRAVRKIMKDER